MKKIILLLILVVSLSASGQTTNTEKSLSQNDSLTWAGTKWLEQIELNLSLKERYKLYPTQNMYNFLLLDTKTGQIEQIQWSMKPENEIHSTINSVDLTYGQGYGSRSFELIPTQNMYTFLLVDKTTGRIWHVQWGLESSKRGIWNIY